jgi:arabinogalactan oligomer/maltooligosaccharide transport system permease protein
MSTGTQPTRTDPTRKVAESSRSKRAGRIADHASGGVVALLVKITLLAVVDAIAVYALFILFLKQDWLIFAIVVLGTAAINIIYFSKRMLPAKYLAPGLVFLLIFQIFVIGYTAYISFTNYGTGHNSTKEDAVTALIQSAQYRVPDSPTYGLTIVEQLGTYSFLVTDPDGDVSIGNDESPLSEVSDADLSGGKAVALPGYTSLTFADILANQDAIAAMTVQISDDPNDGALRTPDGSSAYLYLSTLTYDEAADTMTNTDTDVVYADSGNGAFTSDDGEELLPGWSVVVGAENYVKAFTDETIRGPLLSVTAWTFAFALLSVATTFVLGLFLAIVFNDIRMRGRKFYRVLMIGADIPWLTNEWLAKGSILFVNLWLGFPYMFLVCTGALQSIPEELQEAATVDGASPWQVFQRIKFPLLLVSVAPLLIASFAFNFNNFNLIYMLTNGGPRDASASINVGASDILISMVYKVAFVGANRDYGLASAFSIIIFLIVAVIAIVSFRQTKALEDLN